MYPWRIRTWLVRLVECLLFISNWYGSAMRIRGACVRVYIDAYASERNTLQRSWLHTRSLRHRRLSTAFPRPVFLRASLSLANGTPLRDSLAAHRPMHSGERTCLLSHDNNGGDNWSPSLRAFHVSIGGREKIVAFYLTIGKINRKQWSLDIFLFLNLAKRLMLKL